MICRLFIDPPASGAWNMAVDETLLESAAEGGGFSLRFYRWQRPTLSLGYFQQYDDRRQHSASLNCPVVRRASGGGAIVHDREVTYSIAVPPGERLAVRHLMLYETVHAALIEVLSGHGISASLCRDKGREKTPGAPFLCFQRRSPGDVLVSEVKIAGSAQRRRRGAVLQHGSVLLARCSAAPELPGLAEVAAIALSFDQLVQRWSSKLSEVFPMHLEPGILTDAEQFRVLGLAREKYNSSEWTEHRGRENLQRKTCDITIRPPL
ncbi:MAG: biotin/lipoate A/B protein ligase family protein [Thermoguttaceae bacterium]|jgi:lipoate-protein ligase A